MQVIELSMIKVIYSDSNFSIDKPEGLITGKVNSLNIQNYKSLRKAIACASSKGFDINTKILIKEKSDLFYKKRRYFNCEKIHSILSFQYIVVEDKLSVNIKDKHGIVRTLLIEYVISVEQFRKEQIDNILI